MEQNKVVPLTKEAILDRTHYGIKIYAHVLRKYYDDAVVLLLRGAYCRPAKNPFNGNKCTLKVFIQDKAGKHYDVERANFRGDAFGFASRHYQLRGKALLEKLNEEMGLGIGTMPELSNGTQSNGQHPQHPHDPQHPQDPQILISSFSHFSDHPQNPFEMKSSKVYKARAPQFSLFRKPIQNTVPLGYGSMVNIYMLITGGRFRQATEKLRSISDKEKARKFKEKNFDYVTFSGIFSSREIDALARHSGLFCVDLDHVPDVEGLKQRLLQDPYFETELLFVSPSGNGLKWIIPIDIKKASHQAWAKSIGGYVQETYGLPMDPSGKDVARACFLPHDAEAYINPKYVL